MLVSEDVVDHGCNCNEEYGCHCSEDYGEEDDEPDADIFVALALALVVCGVYWYVSWYEWCF